MAAGVAKYNISKLSSHLTNIVVVGVIIARQQPRVFGNKKCPNGQSSTDRAVFNLTLRDSPSDCINVSRWGTVSAIGQEAENFHIGDIVEIFNARVSVRNEESGKFQPFTSSAYNLVVSDDGQINPFTADPAAYKSLLHVPTRPAHDYTILSLVDTKEGKEHLPKAENFLVSVIKVEPVQVINTKDNREVRKQLVRLLDFTAKAVPIEIWDPEYLRMAAEWKPRETVLYIADGLVKWDEFKQCKVISVNSSTLITENPNVPEAMALRHYAKSVPISFSELVHSMSNKLPDLNSITNQMSVQQAKEKIEEGETFTAVINAFLSKLNIDEPQNAVSLRCWHCHQIRKHDENICVSSDCVGKEQVFSATFNVLASITDRTGTLENIRLGGRAADQILGIDADVFLELDEKEVAQVKQKLLLEKWDMKIWVQLSQTQRPAVTLLSCEKPNPHESSARGIAMM
ncbi:meiosis-specific with OB domain-containing protein isoform X1 [Cloeon dipterum]|uniref:meiosis-specific with OB domain-containing protein isoform X1 n=1 Tax=Cloeon dipterum TaxID=197152 RepID=UPI00322053FA